MKKRLLLLLLSSLFGVQSLSAQEVEAVDPLLDDDELFEMSLEELMNLPVVSVSKKEERFQDVAASLYILTAADLERSNATTLHEALMLVPGYWGVQTEYNNPVNNMRFSPAENGNIGSVLYLLDGTPLQDLMNSTFRQINFDIPIEDIDRIEVIRGSGGTIYGANSATGVVNIFTKDPEKYNNKISTRVEVASPNYVNASITGGKKLGEKLSIGFSAKYRLFSGYTDSHISEDSITVLDTKSETNENVTIRNRFTENFQENQSITAGLKLDYQLAEKSKLSSRVHYNLIQRNSYTNAFDKESADLLNGTFYKEDEIFYNEINGRRLTANLRFDQDFSENHSLFARVSTNAEHDFLNTTGGYEVENNIIDFEVQDNITLFEKNQLSAGVNYRLVNFDVKNQNNPGANQYINPQSQESILGFFLQNKLSLLNESLHLTLGAKAENYSLINDKFYVSPNIKVSYSPIEQLTFWGGYTISYTTPGFNLTNIDFLLFERPSEELMQETAQGAVFAQAYADAFEATGDEATATSIAQGYVASEEGQYVQDSIFNLINGGVPNNIGVHNSENTEPTRFSTFEFGMRANIKKKYSFESNWYFTQVSDALTASFNPINFDEASKTRPGTTANYYLYGNYIQGSIFGTETMIRGEITKGLRAEIAYTLVSSKLEVQENPDFKIVTSEDQDATGEKATVNTIDQTPETPFVPENIIRAKIYLDLPKGFSVNTSYLYASTYYRKGSYEYEKQRYTNILGPDINASGSSIGNISDRHILNVKISKSFLDKTLTVYAFGNDLLNSGTWEQAEELEAQTTVRTTRMIGLGATYKF
ncbi:MAG: TonB-dependent receptor plug domain-containing protein [Cytophagales bacterium]|nr:TonB-dependent receptor plug domain-containing protein [Cytophagales bacterium]